jgi:NTP-dependent ternary system trypsin peptidase co-occuring protein
MVMVQFEEDEDVILVELEDESGLHSVSNDPQEFIEKSRIAIERSMKTVQRMAKKAVKTIQGIPISERPSTVQFEFGIKMNGEAGAVIAKAGAEAAITVTMTWEHKIKS